MTLTTEEQQLISDLRDILAERLPYNRTWDNVRLKPKKTYIEIIWFNNKSYHDPRGAIYEERIRIKPLNDDELVKLINRHREKLINDVSEYKAEHVGEDDE